MKEVAGTLLVALVMFIVGACLIYWWDGCPAWSGGLLLALAVFAVIGACIKDEPPPFDVFCADCGQYLGPSNGFQCPCGRCGCNRYTKNDPGVGRTVKNR